MFFNAVGDVMKQTVDALNKIIVSTDILKQFVWLISIEVQVTSK